MMKGTGMLSYIRSVLSKFKCSAGFCSAHRHAVRNDELEQTTYTCGRCGRGFIVRDAELLARMYGSVNGHLL